MKISKTQWITSLSAAFFVHIALAAYFYKTPENEGALGAGEAGIDIGIGLAGTYLEPQNKPETRPEPEPKPERETKPETKTEVTPEIEPEPAEKIVEDSEPLDLPDSPQTLPEELQTVVADTSTATPSSEMPQVMPTPKPSVVQQATGEASQETTGGNPAARQSYFSQLTAWLNEYKEYPFRAKRRRMTGIVTVKFTINKNGELLASEIVEKSGYALLDETALETLKKANPYPPIPDELVMNALTITLPIEFTLKN